LQAGDFFSYLWDFPENQPDCALTLPEGKRKIDPLFYFEPIQFLSGGAGNENRF
jgi:hypothetical protein